ncbi:MAG: helix-turn-helix transcriptional regulator [Oscillospiraceae bacterium]|nr:helix-turn-helix transcriptional regulator [Oscillospiraceae bacterium]
MEMSEKIQLLRKKECLSQEQFAEKLNVSRQAVSKWESGQSMPEIEKITQMSVLFGVTTDYLLKDDMADEPVLPPLAENTDVNPRKNNKRLSKRVIKIGGIALSVVVVSLSVYLLIANHIVFLSSNAKMQYYFLTAMTTDSSYIEKSVSLFNEIYAGTNDEDKALSYFESAVEQSVGFRGRSSFELASLIPQFSGMSADNEQFEKLLDGANTLLLAVDIDDICNYPEKYAEKEVMITGEISSIDPKREMITFNSEYQSVSNNSIELNYSMEKASGTGTDWDNLYPDSSARVAYGYLKKYSNLNGNYLIIYQFIRLDDFSRTTCDSIRLIADLAVTPADEQEAHPYIQNAVPSYYPSDTLPLYRMYNVLNSSDNGDIVVSYQSNGTFEEVIDYYDEILLKLGKNYILQNLGAKAKGLTALLPDSDKCVYVIISDGATVYGKKSDKATIAIAIMDKQSYYDTEGALVSAG